MGLLDGKTVLITGAGNGIGRECALAAATEGASILVNDIGGSMAGEGASEGPAHAVVQEIRACGGKAAANAESVADPEAVSRMVEQARDIFGGLHAIIHSAGIVRRSAVEEMPVDDWHNVMDVHLTGAFNLARVSLSLFRQQNEGTFVFFTSTAGLMGQLHLASYAAAKMGVVGLSRVIAMEMADTAVRSNVVAPFAWTRMVSSIPVGDEAMARAMEKAKTLMRADQVARLCVALCAPGVMATGQIFGARGNELMVFSQPRPTRSIAAIDGWTAEAIINQALRALKPGFTDIGSSTSIFNYPPL